MKINRLFYTHIMPGLPETFPGFLSAVSPDKLSAPFGGCGLCSKTVLCLCKMKAIMKGLILLEIAYRRIEKADRVCE